MRVLVLLLFATALTAVCRLPVSAQTGYPMVTSVYPVGLQRGKITDITITGQQNFAGAYGVLFETPGVSADVVAPMPAPAAGAAVNSVQLRVTAAVDAPLGPQEFRIATPRGLSSVGMLVIGREPEILEKEGNNSSSEANSIELPVTVNGRLQAGEDVDCFRIQVQAGAEVVFACNSARLQDKIHDLTPGSGGSHSDPILILTDADGRELALADDYWGPDPLLAHRFEKAGSYVLQIRDVRYGGSAGWTYRLTCTQDPYLAAVYPMAGERGKSVPVRPIGYNLGGMQQSIIDVPMQAPGSMDLALKAGAGATNPVPFVVSDLAQVNETSDNDTVDKASPGMVPGGFNGRIESENDSDLFRFRGEKGRAYTFEVFARRCGSMLDSYIEILDGQGKTLADNDDSGSKDSRRDWTCAADGDYLFRIRDLHNRGGDTYVYHVAASIARPDFTLRCDDDKALIGPGGGYAMYVRAERRNGFAGDIKLTVEGLPPGVTAACDRIPAIMPDGQAQACVILTAAPDAKLAYSRIRMFGTGEIALPDGTREIIRREVTPLQEIYMPGGGRQGFPVSTHVVSVTEPADVLIKLSASRVELQPGGAAEIDVEVIRQKGYDKPVVLDVILRHLGSRYGDPLPPGVTMDETASKTLLGATDTRGKIVLRAAGSAAAVENLPIAVLGQVSINFVVKVSHASEPLFLTVKR